MNLTARAAHFLGVLGVLGPGVRNGGIGYSRHDFASLAVLPPNGPALPPVPLRCGAAGLTRGLGM